MRDRLNKLLQDSPYLDVLDDEHWLLAVDHLLAEGVIVPPCKVGQTLYALWMGGRKGKGIAEFEVRSINFDCLDDMEIVYRSKKLNATMVRYAKASDFGKTLFFTREEAEQALKEVQG